MTVHKMINDPEAHMITVHASGNANTPVGEYNNEYVFFLTVEGEKIVKIEEFVDSQFSASFMPKLLAYAKQHEDSV